jgi:CubicO group peptidase (beta-lactamase class C family)
MTVSAREPARPSPREMGRCAAELRVRTRSLLLALVALLAGAAGVEAQPAPLQGLDAFIEGGMAEWGIPGLAVAVVKDGDVVFARGYGVRHLAGPEQVDEHTLFGVASVSKAFTAAALGILVDDGVLHWDDPVVKHLPHFRLYDPWVSETVTIRDLLAHRVGVGRMTGNRIRWLPSADRSELAYRIRYLGPEQPFRNGYVYSNVMYMIAGEVVRAASGVTWDDFVRERIFQPLGMARSNTSVTRIVEDENAAWPHQEVEGRVVPIPRRNFDAVGPSASINTSVAEITAWMRLHLGTPGEVDGLRLLEEATVREMHRAQNRIPDQGMTGTLSSYGLGWNLSMYEGRRVSAHGGATDGMNTYLALVPEENLGVVVTTNTFNSFMNAVTNRILDRYLGIEDRAWDEAYRNAYLANHARISAQRDSIHAAREEGTSPSLPLEAYAGSYLDSLYAEVRIETEGDRLVATFWGDPDEVLELEHWHHDTFRGSWRNPAQREKFVWFTRGPDGGVDAFHVRWNLRPALLQVGAYPSGYTRDAAFRRVDELPPLRGAAPAAPVLPPAPVQATVEGVVRTVDPERPVSGAEVALLREGQTARSIVSGADGAFRFTSVARGAYVLRVRAPGLLEWSEALDVPDEGTVERIVHLRRSTVDLDTLRVLGHAMAVRREETEFGPRIDSRAIRSLPVPYEPTDMTAFIPGASGDRIWGGADFRANLYQVDGLSQTHPGTGGPLMSLSPSWIEAVEVRGLGAGADQGNFQGAVVNLVTRSGGDRVEGQVRTSLENHRLNATNIVDGEVGRERARRSEIEGEVGGPIVPGALHYFAAGHLLEENVRARSRLPGFDDPFLPFLEERREGRFFGKLSWTPGTRDRFELSGARNETRVDGWGQDGYMAPEALGRLEQPSTFTTVSWLHGDPTQRFLEARATRATARDSFEPGSGTDVPSVRHFTFGDPPSSVFHNSEFRLHRRPETRSFSARAQSRFTTGPVGHRLQVGGEIGRSRWTDQRQRTAGMTWRPAGTSGFDPQDTESWVFGEIVPATWGGEVDLHTRMTGDAFWIQDNVALHPRLTLTPGARWGRWQGTLLPGGRAEDAIRAVDDSAWEPRMGAIVDVPGAENLLVKAHWGRYHQNLLSQFFDRVEGGEVFSNLELWYHRGHPAGPHTSFTRDERDALADAGVFHLVELIRLNETGPVSPDYRQPRVDQWLVGVETNVGDRVRLEAVWVDRANRNIVALRDRNLETNYTGFRDILVVAPDGQPYLVDDEPLRLPEVYIPNDWILWYLELIASGEAPHFIMPPGMSLADMAGLTYEEDFRLENVSGARRHTRQLQLTAHVLGTGWAGMLSVVYTRVVGNFDSVTGYQAGSDFERVWDLGAGPWVRPNERANFDGRMPGHAPLDLKLLVHGELPWALRGGAFLRAARGERFTPHFQLSGLAYGYVSEEHGSVLDSRLVHTVAGQRVFTGPRGSARYGDRFALDLRVEREFPVAGNRWSVTADLFNAWNSGVATRINPSLNYPSRQVPGTLVSVDSSAVFGAVWSRIPPRTLRLGVAARF